jgi:AcrR family transcriptional regulator
MDQTPFQLEIDQNAPTAERILQIATSYFARLGYYGVSVRDIAREIGLSVATLYYYIESKDTLYRRVFERQYIEEYELVANIIQKADEQIVRDPQLLRELLLNLVDVLIDRAVQNPDIVRLWTRRWLEKPLETEDIEAEYSAPLYQMCDDLLKKAEQAGTIRPAGDYINLLTHSVTWLLYGYCGFGRLSFEARFKNPYDPEAVKAFRAFMHTLVSKMLRFSDQD